jgi:hypothetical protein
MSGTSRRAAIAGMVTAIAAPAVAVVAPAAEGTHRDAELLCLEAMLARLAPIVISSTAAGAPEDPDAELIALCRRHIANLHARSVSSHRYDYAMDNPDFIACCESRNALHDAHAKTIEGVIAKARAAQIAAHYWAGDIENYAPGDDAASQFAWEIVCDLVAIMGAKA